MVKLGNILFHYRNFLFPVFYFLLFIPSRDVFDNIRFPIIAGFTVAALGQLIRVGTIGLVYIIRGGKNRQIYAEGLVTEGVFSHCRNPLYVGNILVPSDPGGAAFMSLLATDELGVSKSGITSFYNGTQVLTGRALNDDVIDVELILVFGGPTGASNPGLTSDHVNANDKTFLSTFPYLAEPW